MAISVIKVTMVLVFACIMVAAPLAEAAITCGQIVNYLTPCAGYMQSDGGAVPAQCCAGIRSLNSAASTTPDRQAACTCLKQLAASMPGVSSRMVELASGLPGKCHVNVGYPISASVDCSKVR